MLRVGLFRMLWEVYLRSFQVRTLKLRITTDKPKWIKQMIKLGRKKRKILC